MDPHRPALSVVVVTFRSRDALPSCLAALRASVPPATELHVVDNAGDDGVRALAERLWPGARVTINAVNRGFGAAVNQAVRAARGEAILLLNPDAIVEPNAVPSLRAALRSLPDGGAFAPVILGPSGAPDLTCYPFLTLGTVIWRHFQLIRLFPNVVLGRYRRRTLAGGEPFAVDWAQGACLLLRRAVFEQVGGFDEDFFFYAEEVDLLRRIARAGRRTYVVPAARVRHAEGASSTQVVPLKLASHYLSKVVYFEKHHGPATCLALRAILLADLGLRMLYRALGVLRGRPPDARTRLSSYALTARLLLTRSTPAIVARWRRLGARAAQPIREQTALPSGRRAGGEPPPTSTQPHGTGAVGGPSPPRSHSGDSRPVGARSADARATRPLPADARRVAP